jgi:hypothetical protein
MHSARDRDLDDLTSLALAAREGDRAALERLCRENACFGGKEALFREPVALYGTIAGEPPRRALREPSTARAAIEAMLRAPADAITLPDTPHGCMLILAAPTGAIENSGVRAFLAGLRHDMFSAVRDRLARGIAGRRSHRELAW